MDGALRAIAEPTRREILRLVWEDELPAGEIAGHFDVSRAAVSQHLRVLKEADLVTERRVGTSRRYRAGPERIEEVGAGLGRNGRGGLEALDGVVVWDQRGRPRRDPARPRP